jgi:hypothetical protein
MICITTPDGLQHVVESAEAIADYSTSLATLVALQTAYAAGDWEPCDPPETTTVPEPDPSGFRVELARCASWISWAASIPTVYYTNLVIAAAQDNWPEAQAFYTTLAQSYPPAGAAVAEWQALADAHGVPIEF